MLLHVDGGGTLLGMYGVPSPSLDPGGSMAVVPGPGFGVWLFELLVKLLLSLASVTPNRSR